MDHGFEIYFISGLAMTTWGFPPRTLSLAWASPKARDTERRPGRTLWGPYASPPDSMTFNAFSVDDFKVSVFVISLSVLWIDTPELPINCLIADTYILPPASITRSRSLGSHGL
jgi:hypothetical protein